MSVNGFLNSVRKKGIPLHSFLLWQDGEIKAETHCPQTPPDALHRMFSISKSLTAVCVGLLYAQHTLSLDDKICSYFEDKVTATTGERIKAMTIRDMLMMRTCHSKTTYKLAGCTDWVGSFFTAAPDHDPGTLWHYDTSSAHVLAALVERLSGMSIIGYYNSMLPMLAMSDGSHFICDPQGSPLGGSGLCCTTCDLLHLALMLYDAHKSDGAAFAAKYCPDDRFDTELFLSFILTATSKLSPTEIKANERMESHGYGYMIWQAERGGFLLYGMGGQLVGVYPGSSTIFITTADTQSIRGGNDCIMDAFYEHILDAASGEGSPYAIPPLSLPVTDTLPFAPFSRTYSLSDNKQGFTSLHIDASPSGGRLVFGSDRARFDLVFGFNALAEGVFPVYEQKYYGYGSFQTEDMLFIKLYVIDDYVGSVQLQLHFSKDKALLNLFMKKVEESLFTEFSGHLSSK